MADTVTLKSGKSVKLGRIRPIETFDDPSGRFRILVFPGGKARATVKLGKHFNAAKDSSPPPAKVDWYTKAKASLDRVYLNDQYGDCVIAGKYHQVGVWSANDNTQGEQSAVVGSDQEVLSMYHTICGAGDNGCIITDVLDYFKNRGLPFNGTVHKIDGYVSLDWTNKLLVQVAIEVFGSLTIGINLPNDWTCTDCTWDVTNARIVGGHDVCCVGYDEKGVQIATWGGIVTITWAAFLKTTWIEECYAELSPDWYGQDKMAANGINYDTLLADLKQIGGGGVPDPGPGPTPPPPPPPPPPVEHQVVVIPDQTVTGTVFGQPWVTVKIPGGTYPVTSAPAMMGPDTIPWSLLLILLRQGIAFVCSNIQMFPVSWQPIIQQICGVIPHAKEPCGGCK